MSRSNVRDGYSQDRSYSPVSTFGETNTRSELRREISALKREINDLRDRNQEAPASPNEISLGKLVRHYNRTRDWARLKSGLEALLHRRSGAYKQLQSIMAAQEVPLKVASANGYVELLQVLLKAGLDVNIRVDASNNTMLHTAAHMGRDRLAELLLDHGADIHAINARNETALTKATLAKHISLVKMLQKRAAGDSDLLTENVYSSILF